MRVPLFRRPGTVVVLDDDVDFLAMLSMALPRNWHINLFSRVESCIEYLAHEPPYWEADAWTQMQMIANWQRGMPLIPQILQYWGKYTERWALARTLVIDYAMPVMNGIQVLSRLENWQGSRLLLTGLADAEVAAGAFNQGVIDKFIPKQGEILTTLTDSLDNLLTMQPSRQSQAWAATLTVRQIALLRDETVARDLINFARWRWVEHVLIGAPFGIIGMDGDGRVDWVPLAARDDLPELAMDAQRAGHDADGVDAVQLGRQLSNASLCQAFPEAVSPALETARPFGDSHGLVGAVFELDASISPGRDHSYNNWLTSQAEREIHA